MQDGQRLAGRVAVVTGAAQGIGKAIALAFAAQGARLYLLDLRADLLPEVTEAAAARGVEAAHAGLDVTQPDAVEAAMQAAEARFGQIDILVNGAGVFHAERFLDYRLEDWERVMAVNLTGSFLCAQAALRRMVPRGRGRVVNLASVAGKSGGRFRAAYYASKHAVIGLTRCLALEMAPHGITVNAICPGLVDTGLFDGLLAQAAPLEGASDPEALRATLLKRVPLGRMIRPEEVAHLAVYLASGEAEAMTGQALTLSGGFLLV